MTPGEALITLWKIIHKPQNKGSKVKQPALLPQQSDHNVRQTVVGSSILKGVKNNDLKTNTTVISFSGATTEMLKERRARFDINNCKTAMTPTMAEI